MYNFHMLQKDKSNNKNENEFLEISSNKSSSSYNIYFTLLYNFFNIILLYFSLNLLFY
jgi:hypothetical protein